MPRAYIPGYDYGRRFFLGICIVGLVGGSSLLICSENQRSAHRESLNWPVVTGTMMQADLGSRSSHGRHPTTVYSADISYTYVANDKRYLAHQVSLWNPKLEPDRREARTFLAQHPVGSTVEVHYHPQHPDLAVLVPGADETSHVVQRWASIAALVTGALGLFHSRKSFGVIRRTPFKPPVALAR